MISVFKPSPYELFGEELARDLAEKFPPSLEDDEKSSSKKRLASALLGWDRKVAEFKQNHSLGVYRKAKIANAVKWGLKEGGYSKPFVEKITRHIVARLSS